MFPEERAATLVSTRLVSYGVLKRARLTRLLSASFSMTQNIGMSAVTRRLLTSDAQNNPLIPS